MKTETIRTQIKEAAQQIAEGLKGLEKNHSEGELEKVLKEDVFPPLLNDKTVFGTSIWNKMDVVKTVQIDSILDERSNNLEHSIRLMGADGICWLSEHVMSLNNVMECIEDVRRAGFDLDKNGELKHSIEALNAETKELTKWLLEDAFERNQNYEYELKQLNGRK